MSDQIPFSAIVQISSLSNTTKLSLIEEECKSQAIEPTNIFENILKHIEVNNTYLLDLMKEWNTLSIIDMKLLLQQELYELEWSNISTEDISISLDQFKINWQLFNENNNDNIEELGTLSELMLTLKWRKRQVLTFHERLLI